MSVKAKTGQGCHILAKPNGPVCNLGCKYCFYLEKRELYPEKNNFLMPDGVLEKFVKEYIQSQNIPEIQFVWQGGEPLLAGISFYQKVIGFQQKHMGDKKIVNSMQTNGILLNNEWCAFLKDNGFLVGLSLDGPEEIHDRYRLDLGNNPTHAKVINALELLRKYEIPFNVLVCVTRQSCEYPDRIYAHLKELGVQYIQFTPIVERYPDEEAEKLGLNHSSPGIKTGTAPLVTDYSVLPEEYGDFLISVFEEWVRNDVGNLYIMNFEWALESWMGLPSTICIYSKQCGRALAVEHNGDIYSCDHFVFPEYRLGNLLETPLSALTESPAQTDFGKKKEQTLSSACRQCDVRFACNGECPRLRFVPLQGSSGEYVNYLCGAYKKYFRHIHRYMKAMVQLIQNGKPASWIMDVIEGPVIITKD